LSADVAASARNFDVDAALDAGRLSVRQSLLPLLCFLIVAADGFDTQSIAFVASELREYLGLDSAQLGLAFSISTFGGVFSGFLAGPLADRQGRRPWIVGTTFAFA
jgi:MFS transporter, AAHS family, 4-hydroxybenzoate transporter